MRYWQGEGKYQKELEELTNKLIPQSGEAETSHGELLRLYNRFAYDVYNNGLCNTDSLGDLFRQLVIRAREIPIGSKAEYLIDNLDKLMEAIDENKSKSNWTEETYEECSECDGSGSIEDYEGEVETCDTCCGSGEIMSDDDEWSEQEEHWEYVVKPLFDGVTEDDDGISELGDNLIRYVINIDDIIESEK